MGRRCDEGKVRYPSHAAALKSVIKWRYSEWKRGGKRKYPTRAYLCPFCDKWHLTSQDKNKPRPAWKIARDQRYREILARRQAETPIFDRLIRERHLTGPLWTRKTL